MELLCVEQDCNYYLNVGDTYVPTGKTYSDLIDVGIRDEGVKCRCNPTSFVIVRGVVYFNRIFFVDIATDVMELSNKEFKEIWERTKQSVKTAHSKPNK